MVDPRFSPRRGRLLSGSSPLDDIIDEDDEDDDEDIEDDEPRTSIEDLTQPADPQEFDQTFRDDDAPLSIEGPFDPSAGSKQVIPRVAFTINYNFVYNPEKDRWEPDEGNEGGGGLPPAGVLRDVSTANVSGSAVVKIGWQEEFVATGPTPDKANDEIAINETAKYEVTFASVFVSNNPGDHFDVTLNTANRGQIAGYVFEMQSNPFGRGRRQVDLGVRVKLDAGDAIFAKYQSRSSATITIAGQKVDTHLSVRKVA